VSKRVLIAAAFVAGMACGGLMRAGLGFTQTHEVTEAISVAAAHHGVSEQRLRCLAFRESRFQPWAYNRAGYHGLYQFDWATWTYGSRLAGLVGASPYDPWAAAEVTALLIARGEGSRWPPLRWC
jgi:hypothetical protein